MRAISRETYKQFAKLYGIRLSKVINGKRKLKTMRQLAQEIYNYESSHDHISNGLYFYEN